MYVVYRLNNYLGAIDWSTLGLPKNVVKFSREFHGKIQLWISVVKFDDEIPWRNSVVEFKRKKAQEPRILRLLTKNKQCWWPDLKLYHILQTA